MPPQAEALLALEHLNLVACRMAGLSGRGQASQGPAPMYVPQLALLAFSSFLILFLVGLGPWVTGGLAQ